MNSSLHFKMLTLGESLAFVQICISKREARSGRDFGGHLTFLLNATLVLPSGIKTKDFT